MHRLLSLSLLLVISLVATRIVHADTLPTLTAYHQHIREAYAAAQRSDRIGLDGIVVDLAAIQAVKLDDGTVLPVDNRWLQVELEQEPPPFALITAQLGAILEALNQPHTPPNADALQKLENVFKVPPFRDRPVPSALTRGWNNFWSAIGRGIERFFNWVFGSGLSPSRPVAAPSAPAAPASGWAGLSGWGTFWLLVGLLLVVTLMVYAVRGVKGSFVRDAKARTVAEAEAELTATAALERAQSEARTGDYRTAVRFLYLSSLLWLHEQRLLRYDHALTNREYLQQLDGKPLQAQLAPVVETFDRVWYGKRELASDEFQAYEAQIAQLHKEPGPRA